MVELLSEGDINKNDKKILIFDDMIEGDYFSFFENHISKNCNQNVGLALYVDVFKFSDVIDFLRTRYNLTKPEEEIKYGSKFNYVIYFDKDLNFLSDLTFFTVSGFIHNKNEVPNLEKFREYEAEQKTKLEQYFDFEENNTDDADDVAEQNIVVKPSINPIKFNEQIIKVLNLLNNGVSLSNCRIQIINNVESDAINLHSFFVDDLEKAKNISTENLNKYLLGASEKRINLDSKKESVNFNPKALMKILQPQNYPLGRFPSNTEYALSFMQQIAVNLSVGLDSSQMRSVNGPPGTGKTTLLKDIFAELVVKQSCDICRLSAKKIQGGEDTRYFEKLSIGMVPENIAQNSIVVASSNNGAVQNIVNELPLLSGVSENLLAEIKLVDYFRDIANSDLETYWTEGTEKIRIIPKDEVYWGLFSLEGGRAENMKNIISCIKAILQCFDNDEYVPDPTVYEHFEKQLIEVEKFRARIEQVLKDKKELSFLLKEEHDWQNKIKFASDEKTLQKECDVLASQYAEIQEQIERNTENCKMYSSLLENLNKNKPGFLFGLFAKRDEKEAYNQKCSIVRDSIAEALNIKQSLERQQLDIKERIRMIREKLEQVDNIRRNFDSWKKINSKKICELKKKTAMLNEIKIDVNKSYDELQLSNPWYNEEYRILQSKLFIAALGVRKQFLYENRKNIKAATIIWGKQNDYLEKKQVISAAWKWINFVIPVISSTFASFGKMFKNIEPNSLGHLFIDEAGQALPQASVGAIFRSKHVMVVGDPAQIKPVLTLEPGVLGILKKHFNVSEKYLSDSASTQTLVDAVSQYGYYRAMDKSDSSWIGIPLWVHRRCQYPMFTISNKISYNDMMVQGNQGDGKTGWYNIKGKANNKYVKEQGEFLANKIQEMIDENPKIVDKEEKDIIYVISPFSNVAFQLARELDKINFTRRDGNGKPTNIGTVHTFQGKEAPIVFMVLGADSQSKGAAAWAVNESNMMNVAATRAKKEFYIVGDKELYLSLGSDIVQDTYSVMMQYKKEHPDLFFDAENEQVFSTKSGNEIGNNSIIAPKLDENESILGEGATRQGELRNYKASVNVELRYIGNRKNNSFHRVTCKYAPKYSQKRVEFFSREEALECGFTPCNTCKA